MKILLTTDFSEASYHAIDYIKSLSRQWPEDNTFVLAHSYQSLAPYPMSTNTLDPHNPGIPIIEDKELESTLRRKLKELGNELKEQVHVDGEYFEAGSLARVIEDLVNEEKPDLIVMGTSEKNALERMAVGTNTMEVVSKTSVPVLAVPKEAAIAPVKHLSYGLNIDDERAEAENITFLKQWVNLTDSQLEVVYVAEEGDKAHLQQRMSASQTHKMLTGQKHDHHILMQDDVYEGLTRYVNENKPDILAITAGERSVWDRLFHLTKTEKLMHHLQVPVLLL